MSSESDQTTVWVHLNGETVARYGKLSFEIFSSEEPRRLINHGRSSTAESWLEFKDRVRHTYDYEIDEILTPVRFLDELGLAPGFETGQPTFVIALREIVHLNDPFEHDIWGRGQVTREDVARCIEEGKLASGFVQMGLRDRQTAGWDAQRIAYFVVHPSDWPIDIEVISADGDFLIEDGCHRLASKVYAHEDVIKATIGGYLTGMAKAFPSRVPISPDAIALLDGPDEPEMHLVPSF